MTTNFILREATEAELANAVEENLHDMFRSMVNALNGEIDETPELGRFYVAPASPIFKGVFRANFSADEADAVIEETIAWYRQRNAPFFFLVDRSGDSAYGSWGTISYSWVFYFRTGCSCDGSGY